MRIKLIALLVMLVWVASCAPAPVAEPTVIVPDPTDVPVVVEPTDEPTAAPEPTDEPSTESADSTELESTEGMAESEAANEQSAEIIAAIVALAPEGTDISATPPDRGHDENITYPFGGNPLPGGTHHPIWYQCGVYYAPLFTQAAIHSMEHGAVWITYNPDTVVGPAVTTLAAYASGQPFVLVSPFPEQDSPIAVTAWGLQMLVEEPNDERIQSFIEAFANGPQNPEPGATCAQGLTETMDG